MGFIKGCLKFFVWVFVGLLMLSIFVGISGNSKSSSNTSSTRTKTSTPSGNEAVKACFRKVEFWYGVSGELNQLVARSVDYFIQGNKKEAYKLYNRAVEGYNALSIPSCDGNVVMAERKSSEVMKEIKLWFEADSRGETQTAELHHEQYIKYSIELMDIRMKIRLKLNEYK